MKLTQQFFIISDFHFGHKNIVKYENRPDNYAEIIVHNWNQVVKKEDKVLFLGDLALTSKEDAFRWCSQLQGEKYMLLGNHDSGSDTWYKDLGFMVVPSIYKVFKDKYEKYFTVLFTHEPVRDLPHGWYNIHGHIHSKNPQEYKLTPRHYNACVEVLNYTPKKLYAILDEVRSRDGKRIA